MKYRYGVTFIVAEVFRILGAFTEFKSLIRDGYGLLSNYRAKIHHVVDLLLY